MMNKIYYAKKNGEALLEERMKKAFDIKLFKMINDMPYEDAEISIVEELNGNLTITNAIVLNDPKLNDKDYIDFKIMLRTPYLWGPGYAEASRDEVAETEHILVGIKDALGFSESHDRDMNALREIENICYDFNAPKELKGDVQRLIYAKEKGEHSRIYYNSQDDMEEIFIHPMEITGTLSKNSLEKLIGYLKKAGNNSKIFNIDYSLSHNNSGLMYTNAVRDYSYKEVNEILSRILEILADPNSLIVKSLTRGSYYSFGLAMNADLSPYGFKFKSCLFASTQLNKKVSQQRYFIIDAINEALREITKRK